MQTLFGVISNLGVNLAAVFVARIFLLHGITRRSNMPYLCAFYSAFDIFLFSKEIILAFVQIPLQVRTRASRPLPGADPGIVWFCLLALCTLVNSFTTLTSTPTGVLSPLPSETPWSVYLNCRFLTVPQIFRIWVSEWGSGNCIFTKRPKGFWHILMLGNVCLSTSLLANSSASLFSVFLPSQEAPFPSMYPTLVSSLLP